MTITVNLLANVEAELSRQAAACGRGMEAHAASLLEEAAHVTAASVKPSAPAEANDLVELFAPVRGLFADGELDFSRNSSTGRPRDIPWEAEKIMRKKTALQQIFWDVMVRDGKTCQYCGLDGKLDLRILRVLQLDHLRPKCYFRKLTGLRNSVDQECRDNLIVCCPFCNCLKRNGQDEFDPGVGFSFTGEKDADRLALVSIAREHIQGRKLGTFPFYDELFNS